MRANRLGSTTVRVTEIGLGTAQLGGLYQSMDQQTADSVVEVAWEHGVRYFDTAPHYGVGVAEKRLGAALAGRPRDEYTISTKVGRLLVPDGGELVRRWDFSAAGIRRSLEESLERLGLDRIDIALIHDPDDHLEQAMGEALPELERLRAAGIIGAVGVGTGDVSALRAFARDTAVDVLMVAGRLTLLDHSALDDLVPLCEGKGISILNAGVFNSGLLADSTPGPGLHFEYGAAPEEVLTRARRLAATTERFGRTLPAAAMAFSGRENAIASLVLGADTPQQLGQTISAHLGDAEARQLLRALEDEGLIPRSARSEKKENAR